jgi:HPt (histidine-containing phosphotransfer) domain-containing protein
VWFSNAGCRPWSNVDDPPILDRERLKLITRGNAALAAEFLGVMFEEADDLIQRLDGLLARGDRVAVADVAHTLKGMASELGAMQFRIAAVALETEAQPALWPEDVARLRATLTELRDYLLENP